MIPESSEKNGIFLYPFISFPNKLGGAIKICDGHFVDTALIGFCNNIGLFFTYNAETKELFLLEYDFLKNKHSLKLISKDNNKSLRPAGNAFQKGNLLLFPFQDSKEKYGKAIVVREIKLNTNDVCIGEIVDKIDGTFISGKIDRIHTLNYSGNLKIVDYMIKKISLIKPFKMIKRKMRRKKSKKIYG